MATDAPYPDYDDVFLFYNQLRRRFDSRLKPFGLTLTGLQILVAIEQAKERRSQATRASVAAALGLTDSSMSTAVKRLTDIGYIQQKNADDAFFKNQSLRLEPAGRQAMFHGLVIRGDCLAPVDGVLSLSQRKGLFGAARAINEAAQAASGAARHAAYLKTLTKHRTRTRARNAS